MSSTDGDVESSRSTRNTQRVQEQEPHRHQLAASRRKTDFSIDGLLSDSASYGRLARATSPGLVANAGGDSLTNCREREPSSSFEWLQCSRYRPPKLPRKFLDFVVSRFARLNLINACAKFATSARAGVEAVSAHGENLYCTGKHTTKRVQCLSGCVLSAYLLS